jgi:hypothetical protein
LRYHFTPSIADLNHAIIFPSENHCIPPHILSSSHVFVSFLSVS